MAKGEFLSCIVAGAFALLSALPAFAQEPVCESCTSPIVTANLMDLRSVASPDASGCFQKLGFDSVKIVDCMEYLYLDFTARKLEIEEANARAIRCADVSGDKVKKAYAMAYASQHFSEKLEQNEREVHETLNAMVIAARDYLRATQVYNSYTDNLKRLGRAIVGSKVESPAEKRMNEAGNRVGAAHGKLARLGARSPDVSAIFVQVNQVTRAAGSNIDGSLKKLDEIEKGLAMAASTVLGVATAGYAIPAIATAAGASASTVSALSAAKIAAPVIIGLQQGTIFFAGRSALRAVNAKAHDNGGFWCNFAEEMAESETLLLKFAPLNAAIGAAFVGGSAALANPAVVESLKSYAPAALQDKSPMAMKGLTRAILGLVALGSASNAKKTYEAAQAGDSQQAWSSGIEAVFLPAYIGARNAQQHFDPKNQALRGEEARQAAERARLRQNEALR